ncbi:MAG: RNA polymerase sigma factor region1.1 domain-containing protein, partial [Syntrophomonadaceae bacterium]
MKNLAIAIDDKCPEVQLLVKGGREKGYLLYEEIHTVLSDEATAEPSDLEQVYERL